MDLDLRESLIELKEITLNGSESEIPLWVRERFAVNLTDLLEKDASRASVKNRLIGGFRAIYDYANPPEDDPVIARLGLIVDES